MEGEGEGEEDSSISSVFSPLSVLCPVFILFVSIPCFSSCLPSGYLLFHLPHANTHFLFSFFFLFHHFSTRRPSYFTAGRPLPSDSDEWPWLLYRFPNWNNLGTKQVAVYHIDFPLNSVSPFKVTQCIWMNTWAKAQMNAQDLRPVSHTHVCGGVTELFSAVQMRSRCDGGNLTANQWWRKEGRLTWRCIVDALYRIRR